MPGFNLNLLALTLVLCFAIKAQRSPRSVWQGMFCEPLTTDDASNTPKPRSRPAIDAESFAHSFLVLFFIVLRHHLQMLLAMCMTNGRPFCATCGGAKAGGFALLVLTLVWLDLLERIILGAITIPIKWAQAPQLYPDSLRMKHSSLSRFGVESRSLFRSYEAVHYSSRIKSITH